MIFTFQKLSCNLVQGDCGFGSITSLGRGCSHYISPNYGPQDQFRIQTPYYSQFIFVCTYMFKFVSLKEKVKVNASEEHEIVDLQLLSLKLL